MCPLAIDQDKMQQGSLNQVLSLDPAKPPTKPIPHMEFPRVVYKHPVEPFVTIEHRNAKFEVVGEEVVPTEHLTRVIPSEVHMREAHPTGTVTGACSKYSAELKEALAEGWVTEPYVPEAPPDPREKLYAQKPKGKTA